MESQNPREQVVAIQERQRRAEKRALEIYFCKKWAEEDFQYDADAVRHLFFAGPEIYSELISRHPGYGYDLWARRLKNTERIMVRCLDRATRAEGELFQNLKYARNADSQLEECTIRITSEIFTISCLSTTFIQQVRHFCSAFEDFSAYWAEHSDAAFNDKSLVAFVKSLRNFFNHGHLLEAMVGYELNFEVEPDVKTKVGLSLDELRNDKTIKGEALDFVKNKDEIKIIEILSRYIDSVTKFVNSVQYDDRTSFFVKYNDFKRLTLAKEMFGRWLWLNVILDNVIKKGINPYERLHEYFTDREISYFRRFPDHSKEQVEAIIRYFDLFDILGDRDRARIFQLFQIGGSDG